MTHELTSLQLEPRPLGWEARCACGWHWRYRSQIQVLRRWHNHADEEAENRRQALGPDDGGGAE